MAIIKWEPLSELDRIFEDRYFPAISFPSISSKFGWDISVDMYEEKGNLIAKMTLPGINPDDIEISVEEDRLRISGKREEGKETKDKNYYSKKMRRGSFSRVLSLPKSVDASKTSAEYKDGILQVTLPTTGETKSKAVKVRVAR
ncbi:MAG: Hsp20/alpha crystallin family protein [bacterium]|nr:Hsp20/alpha crystallin family protein [bacterium]